MSLLDGEVLEFVTARTPAAAAVEQAQQEHQQGAAAARGWSAAELATVDVLADMATAYLINASTLHQRDELNEQLREALDSRVVIEQAKGIIANHRGTDVDTAFQLLRRHTRNHNTSLRAVAEAVVSSGLRV